MTRGRPTTCAALLTIALAIAAMPAPALAWGKEGHAIVALIARHYLTPKAAKAVDALLAADAGDTLTAPDMASRAAWADVWRNSHRETAPWHFTDIEIDGSNTADLACANDNCLTRRLSLFEAQLASKATAPADRIMALKFVLHFAGDLHQPLHLADNHDKGGNCVHLNGGNARENLHHFWDTVAVEAMGADTDAVASQLFDAITPAQLRSWRSGDIDSWAMESNQVARRVTYSLQSQPGCGSSQDGPRYDLPAGYDAGAIKAARTQLQRAGVRLAVLLNKAVG
jgi:hypothetical protein